MTAPKPLIAEAVAGGKLKRRTRSLLVRFLAVDLLEMIGDAIYLPGRLIDYLASMIRCDLRLLGRHRSLLRRLFRALRGLLCFFRCCLRLLRLLLGRTARGKSECEGDRHNRGSEGAHDSFLSISRHGCDAPSA